MSENAVEIHNLFKKYKVTNKENCVINDLNLTIKEHEFVSVLGYTGCGKSTLLRIICGLESYEDGEVLIFGEKNNKPTKDTILIYQDLNQLFPWKTALKNITYVLRKTSKKMKRRDAVAKAEKFLEEVGLKEFANYFPHQMSGGMRQRCAVARALSMNPRMLLMDEPFSALDEVNRRKLQTLCRNVFENNNLTVLFVTHSVDESISLSDRIVIMGKNDGNIIGVLENTYQYNKTEEQRMYMRNRIMKLLNSQYM